MKKIIISGFGGQGVLSLGLFIAYSAMQMQYNTSWLPSYGPEMRGGTANCSVTYSRREIACPVISAPDFLVAMNEPSLDKFEGRLTTGGTLLVNSSIVRRRAEREDIRAYYVPVDELCGKAENSRGGNIVLLGALLPLLGSLSTDAAVRAIQQVFATKPKVIDANLRCLDFGRIFIEETLRL